MQPLSMFFLIWLKYFKAHKWLLEYNTKYCNKIACLVFKSLHQNIKSTMKSWCIFLICRRQFLLKYVIIRWPFWLRTLPLQEVNKHHKIPLKFLRSHLRTRLADINSFMMWKVFFAEGDQWNLSYFIISVNAIMPRTLLWSILNKKI